MATATVHALSVGEEYLSAWKRKDIHGIERLVHPDIHLKSPITEVIGKHEFLKTCESILKMLEDVRVQAKFASENQAVFIYEFLLKPPLGPVKTANLLTLEGDLIRSVELIFDSRPFERPKS